MSKLLVKTKKCIFIDSLFYIHKTEEKTHHLSGFIFMIESTGSLAFHSPSPFLLFSFTSFSLLFFRNSQNEKVIRLTK